MSQSHRAWRCRGGYPLYVVLKRFFHTWHRPLGIGRQKNILVKVLPLLLLGAWGRRKIRELVLGPRS